MSPQSQQQMANFSFGIRKQEQEVKVARESHRIRKPPLPLPQVQYRPPIIIHTYSPKVIHTEPDDFMSLVQKLTGSSDTRLRLKKVSLPKKKKSTSLDRQGSGSSSTNCGSPSVSEDSSSFVVGENSQAKQQEGKQSNSPRSPFDSHFEFDNVSESMFSHFDHPFSQQQVKVEPMFAYHDNSNNNLQNQFSFLADQYMHQQPRQAHVAPQVPEQLMAYPVYNSLQAPDLPPTAAWSQSFLDCLGAPALSTSYVQFPPQRQRFSSHGAVYAPSAAPTPESSTMVALKNIHAFLST